METQQTKITKMQDQKINQLLNHVAVGIDGFSTEALKDFVARVKAVAADEQRKNTKAARLKENTRLQCYGKALDALIADKIIGQDKVQEVLDKVVESNIARKILGLAQREPDLSKKQRGRPTGSKNRSPKGGGLVKMENGADGAYLQVETEGDEQPQIEAQHTTSTPGDLEYLSDEHNGTHPNENHFVQSEETAEQGQLMAQDDGSEEQFTQDTQAEEQHSEKDADATTSDEDDEAWASLFPHQPGSPREKGGTWLGVLIGEKNEAKKLGARWDKAEGQWYTLVTNLAPFKLWLRSFFRDTPLDQPLEGVQVGQRLYLHLPYPGAERKAESMGAIFDEDHKRYYVADGDDPQRFANAGFSLHY